MVVELYEDSIEVNAPVAFCYQRWRNFSALPTIFHNVRAIHPLGEGVWRWELFDAVKDTSNWDLLLVDDIQNRLISWESLVGPGLDMKTEIGFQAINPARTRLVVTMCTTMDDTLTGKIMNELFGIGSPTIGLNLSEFRQATEEIWALEKEKEKYQ